MTSEQDRALKLIEREDAEAARRQEQEAREARESRISDAIQRVKMQDREIAREEARQEAEAEAAEIAVQRHDLEARMEQEAKALSNSLKELEALHTKHASALRRAGRPLGHEYRLTDVVKAWWRDRFGGPNSLTGTPTGHMDAMGRHEERRRKSLPERDPLADVSGYDETS